MDALVRVLDKTDELDMLPPLEVQTDIMVDSMSPPHVAEYVSAQNALSQDCATLQSIDEDIEECQRHIARAHAEMRLLERRRDAVQRRVSIHRARLSPLRTVPDQVLQEIFQYCLPDTPYVVPNARTAPLILTHVCRRWRSVMHGSSEFWASIALHDRGVWNYELEVEMVTGWLHRSSTRPIRMSITCPPCTDFGPNGNALCSDMFQLVLAHAAQLRDVYLNVNQTYLHHFIERASLPALRSIVIALHSAPRIEEPLKPTTPAVFSAPSLRHIAFKGSGTSINLVPRALFPHITHLEFDCDLTLDLALLFQDFVHLEHLTLTFSLARNTLRFRRPTNYITGPPSLRDLEIHLDRDMLEFGNPESALALLDDLDLPVLQTLRIAAPFTGPRCSDSNVPVTTEPSDAWRRLGGDMELNHPASQWIRSPSVSALLSRSRYAHGPRLEYRDLS
ncbi:hypothetical protein JVU11DRAFT_2488 [Chiua virens]|nr:hypothetical protein JVU11DRAFT_2488 [Chiua virens]